MATIGQARVLQYSHLHLGNTTLLYYIWLVLRPASFDPKSEKYQNMWAINTL